MQATMIAGTIRSRKPRVVSRAADHHRFRELNSQSAVEATATSHPDSLQPIGNEKLDDCEVVRRARDGDARVFEHLYRSHCRRVYALCLRMVGNTTPKEEMYQTKIILFFFPNHT